MIPVKITFKGQSRSRSTTAFATHLDLVHDSRGNDQSSRFGIRVGQGVPPSRNGNPMCRRVNVLPDDVIFATDKNTRWSVKLLGCRVLTSGH